MTVIEKEEAEEEEKEISRAKAWYGRPSPWPWVSRRITVAKEPRQSWNYCVFLARVQTLTTNSRVIIATYSILAYIDMTEDRALV